MKNKIQKIHPLIKKVLDLERYVMKNHYWFAISSIQEAKNKIGYCIAEIKKHNPKDSCKGWD